MNTFWLYFSFVAEINMTVQQVQILIRTHQRLSGPQLEMAASPMIMGLSQLFPTWSIPSELIRDVAAALANAINRYVLRLPTPATSSDLTMVPTPPLTAK
jgi:hypothetical protein